MKEKSSSILFGVILILFGVALLLEKWDILFFSWTEIYPILFIAVSIVAFLSIKKGKKDGAFWGTFLGLLGIFYFLRNYDIVSQLWFADSWPIIILSLGLSFIVLFAFKPYDWGILIPGGILTFLGFVFFINEFHFWFAKRLLQNFWPLLLIFIGIILIASSLSKRSTHKEPD